MKFLQNTDFVVPDITRRRYQSQLARRPILTQSIASAVCLFYPIP